MKKKSVEKRKIPGISYALTQDGIELPVLDVTHPLFVSSVDEDYLQKMIQKVAPDARKKADSFNRIPELIKNYFAKRSYIMAGMMEMTSGDPYVSGLSTLMMKLGPGLIGNGSRKLFDRLASRTIGCIMIRMRARDTAYYLAESIRNSSENYPSKDICLINIGGGTATDSINAMIILLKSDPGSLAGRKIELNILDIDDYGPYFACQSIKALTSEGGVLEGLDFTSRHIKYDWKESSRLSELLKERKGWNVLFSSEGGLFEYGSEEDIRSNLNMISAEIAGRSAFSGSLVKDPESVDPVMRETLHIIKIEPKLYGLGGLKRLTDGTGWSIKDINAKNPRYIVFSLVKNERILVI